MKKIFKALGAVIASGAVVVSLASCSNVTQDYADKIVEKAEDNSFGRFVIEPLEK